MTRSAGKAFARHTKRKMSERRGSKEGANATKGKSGGEHKREEGKVCGGETRSGGSCARKGACPYHKPLLHATRDEVKGKAVLVVAHDWSDVWCLTKRLLLTYKNTEVLFSFDYDATLNGRALTPAPKGVRSAEQLAAKLAEFYETNGQARDFVEFLDAQSIPWIVNTAAGDPERASKDMPEESKKTGKVAKRCSPYFSRLPHSAIYEDAASGLTTRRAGCVFTTDYNKDVTLQQALKILTALPTKVIVHLDDEDRPLYEIAKNDALTSNHLVVLAYFPVVPGSTTGRTKPEIYINETTKETALEWLRENVPLIDLYPML